MPGAYVQLHDGDGQPILPHFGPQRGKAPPKRAPGRYLVPSRRGLALVKVGLILYFNRLTLQLEYVQH